MEITSSSCGQPPSAKYPFLQLTGKAHLITFIHSSHSHCAKHVEFLPWKHDCDVNDFDQTPMERRHL